ncbi:hypothetical protein JA1_004051 [Spathaspora sp. JA1]|nr:hypothetical protein JA1_004051 [Spathaspora sp. JA1]
MTTTKFIIQYKTGPPTLDLHQKTSHHSKTSPFNPESKLYPNGIIDTDWFDKYITQLPFAIVYILHYNDQTLDKINHAESVLKPRGVNLVVLLIGGMVEHSSVSVYPFESSSDQLKLLMPHLMSISHDFYAKVENRIKQRYKKYYTTVENVSVETDIQLTPNFLEIRNLIKQAMILQFKKCSDLTPALTLLELAYDNLLRLIQTLPQHLPHDIKLMSDFKLLLDILSFHIIRGYFSIEEPLQGFKFHKLHIINGDTSDNNWISLQYHWLAELVALIPESIITINNTNKITSFFGGVHLSQFDIISHPSLLLVKAYESNKGQQSIQLLNQALSVGKIPDKFIQYIHWLIGQEYYTMKDYSHAIDHYKLSNCDYFILYQIIMCFLQLNDIKSVLINLIKLSLLSYKQVPPVTITQSIELDLLDDEYRLFSVDVVMFGNTEEPVYVHDQVTLQLVVNSSKVKQNLTKLVQAHVDIVINQIDIIVSPGKGMKSISITHDYTKTSTTPSILHGQELDESFVDSMNLQLEDKLVIHHIQTMTNSGQFEIECIKLQTKININGSTLNKIEIYDKFPTRHNTVIYQQQGRRHKRLTSPSNMIKVVPIKPKISITLLTDLSEIFLGEKLILPVRIEYDDQQQDKPVKLIVKGDLQWNWNSLKDDEALVLTAGTHDYSLHVFTASRSQELLTIEVIAAVDEQQQEEEEVLVYDVASYMFPILKQPPFECNYLINPNYNENVTGSPFVITEDTSMPKTIRLWTGKLNIVNESKLEIVDVEYTIIPSNQEIEIATTESNNELINFTTKSKTNHRNVNVITSAIIKWKRPNSSLVNEYVTPEYQITLPLSDPRVILIVEQHSTEFTLKYILENPTPRIFTFTSSLTFQDWDFQDLRNVVPVKQQDPFPVLPFSEYPMVYYGKYIGTAEDMVKLPSMNIFDVQYKVKLPILAISKTVVKSGELYYKK